MGTTEGIVNSEYQAYERAPTLNVNIAYACQLCAGKLKKYISGFFFIQQIADPSSEHWAPPDSWAVQPPDEEDSHSINMQTTTDYFSVVEHETWNVQSKNVRVSDCLLIQTYIPFSTVFEYFVLMAHLARSLLLWMQQQMI